MTTYNISVSQHVGVTSTPNRGYSPPAVTQNVTVHPTITTVNTGKNVNQRANVLQSLIVAFSLYRNVVHNVGASHYAAIYKVPYIVVGNLNPTGTFTIG